MMTRKEVEKKIIGKLFEIKAIYDEFRAETGLQDDYLAMSLYNDHISANNAYFELPKECHIDCWVSRDKSGEWEEIFSLDHPDGKKEESK